MTRFYIFLLSSPSDVEPRHWNTWKSASFGTQRTFENLKTNVEIFLRISFRFRIFKSSPGCLRKDVDIADASYCEPMAMFLLLLDFRVNSLSVVYINHLH